ncbi:MAG: hypothetical protein JWO94_1395 [Verrucomicrobiaceae bacterium]|nr:hypothetical protein [Verrucomicrobiaceae bacterium]
MLLPAAAAAGPLAPVLQPLIDHHVVTGVVALVADKDRVLDLESAGWSNQADKKPMQNNDLFWIASMTKSITATAFMMLVDEGKADINDPVEKYLPEFKGQQVAEGKDHLHPHAPQHPITIKEVLSHTSGLLLPNDPAIKRTGSLKDEVAQYGAIPLQREPGTKFEYNNTGIDTAGRIIEVLSGVPYADFVQTRLLGPLGMTDTSFWPKAEQARRMAASARFNADKTGLEEIDFAKDLKPEVITRLSQGMKVPHELLVNFGVGKITDYTARHAEPAGGLYSTAADVAKFCQMLLNGGEMHGHRYLSEKALQQMTSIETGEVPVNPQEGYGLGWFVKKNPNEGLSTGSYGHRGARRTVMWIDPVQGLVIVLMVQRMDMTGEQQKELYEGVMKAAGERFGKAR